MKRIDVARVAQLVAKGIGATQIAERLGVRRGAIYRAVGMPWADFVAAHKPKPEGETK